MKKIKPMVSLIIDVKRERRTKGPSTVEIKIKIQMIRDVK